MFKGLRNRFLILHMGVVGMIVFIFFGTVLFSNYQNMENNSNIILNRAFEPFRPNPPLSGDMVRPQPGGFRDEDMRERFSPIFTVELDEDKNIKNIISMFTLQDNFYSEITSIALSKGEDSAKIKYDDSYFKFRVDGGKIVFLDITKEINIFLNTIYTFLWIALPLLLIMFLISLYFANRSIKPIEESYNKQKEFIADASHELKTPISVISTNADMLLGSASAQQKKWLSYIKQEVERMTSLTDSLLYLTKLEYVKENEEWETLSLSAMIDSYLIALEAAFYENRIRTEIQIPPDVNINGDSTQIRRLIGTLIDNAMKYTDEYIRITLEKSGNDAKLIVYNTGRGIKKDELDKVWDRFYRGDKSREKTGGFGLGLAIAWVITQRHGGSITAESVENEWTRFTLKLPLAH